MKEKGYGRIVNISSVAAKREAVFWVPVHMLLPRQVSLV